MTTTEPPSPDTRPGIDPGTAGLPKKHKQALLLWVGIYPTITTVLWVLLPILQPRFPLPVITLIVTALVVPLMSFVVMPLLQKRFGAWLRR